MDEKIPKVYEISFHIVPNITEEEAGAQFEAVKKLIESKEDSAFIAEGHPVLRTLAYEISKTVKAVKSNYTRAYFAWVKYVVNSDEIGSIKIALDEMPTIIRYLIINTVKENTLVTKPDTAKEPGDASEAEEGVVIEDLDKTIEDLVV